MDYKIQKIGTDPEFFVKKNGFVLTSQEAHIEGNKDSPFKINEDVSIQRDNVTAELSISPSSSASEFSSSIVSAIDSVESLYGIQLMSYGSYKFDPEKLSNIPEAMTFGCSTEFSAYTGRPIRSCGVPEDGLRSAGGHIHVSYSPKVDEEFNREIVKAMDIFLGVPSVLIDRDNQRRKIYGAAGSYRDKDYGLEYRSLSNFWLSSEELMEWVFNNTNEAFNMSSRSPISVSDMYSSKSVKKIINENNSSMARLFVEEFNIPMPKAS